MSADWLMMRSTRPSRTVRSRFHRGASELRDPPSLHPASSLSSRRLTCRNQSWSDVPVRSAGPSRSGGRCRSRSRPQPCAARPPRRRSRLRPPSGKFPYRDAILASLVEHRVGVVPVKVRLRTSLRHGSQSTSCVPRETTIPHGEILHSPARPHPILGQALFQYPTRKRGSPTT
jgi:hypothetical protein